MNTISIKRIALLMQKNIYENSTNFLRGFAIYFGILMVIIMSTMYTDFIALQNIKVMYVAGFIILGTVASGTAFSNLRTKEKSMSYLSLPATTFEKLLAEFIISTIVFFVVYAATFYIFNFLMILFGELVDVSFEIKIVNIFNEFILTLYWYFIIFQSVLFAGAATFMKRPLLRTGFTLFLAGVIYLLYGITLVYFIKEYFTDSIPHAHINIFENVNTPYNKVELSYTTLLVKTARYLFDYALAPIFWVVAYLKLKEKQV